jgi:hypothetical protein
MLKTETEGERLEGKRSTSESSDETAEESWIEEGNGNPFETVENKPIPAVELFFTPAPQAEVKNLAEQKPSDSQRGIGKKVFINGLYVGLGIGCITTFVMMWIAVFFSTQLPPGATYESMLSIFIYPLIYLLAVGLIALTAGIVRQYYNSNVRV